MKQSSIEWLVEQLDIDIDSIWAVYQAKQMHKQEIIEARNDGFKVSAEGFNGEYGITDFSLLTKEIESEEYYNKTYETNT